MGDEGQPSAVAERGSFVVIGYLLWQLSRALAGCLAGRDPGKSFMVKKKAQRAGFPTRQADPARQAALRSWRSGRNPGPGQGLPS